MVLDRFNSLLRRLSAVLVVALFAVLPANAWGAEGYAIIADIAEAYLTPVARENVALTLNGARMRDVAYFADDYRLLHPETARWHYVNVAQGADTFKSDRDCEQMAGRGDCIIAAIARNIDDLTRESERPSKLR